MQSNNVAKDEIEETPVLFKFDADDQHDGAEFPHDGADDLYYNVYDPNGDADAQKDVESLIRDFLK